jgi:hypothetical protein
MWKIVAELATAAEKVQANIKRPALATMQFRDGLDNI